MGFNTGLSGLRAASVDLDVTGNNIANASTVGFKGSKAQFGDLYASGFLSAGTNPIGDGVRVQGVKQSFGQGNISFTDNGLDMAIDGDGFFILNNGGEVRYSRAGQFGVDKDGFVVNNQGMKVQGYTADGDGNLSGVRGDLQIETANLAPRRTTNLQTDVNLDSRESLLERRVRDLSLQTGDFAAGETLTFSYSDGSADETVLIPSPINSAGQIADAISAASGVSASGITTAEINSTANGASTGDTLNNTIASGSLEFSINGQPLNVSAVTTLDELANVISSFGNNSISANVDSGNLVVRDSSGEPLDVQWGDGSSTNPIENTVGEIAVSTNRSVDTVTSDVVGSQFVATYNNTQPTRINAFNPIDQRTYNHATSTTIYDSLGNAHEMTQFYVKEPSPGNGVGQSQWSVYLQVDGEPVGGTDQTPYTVIFNQDGELASINGDSNGEIVVTDWVPKDPSGAPNGADGPPADPASVVSPIPEPPTSSAFVLDLSEATQYGAAFGVNDQQQNGYTTGRLSGLDVSDAGVIFARYTNGQSNALGQVALATFSNTDGLSPVGDTSWVETFESGQPVIGAPDTGTLGSIASSSVEESNVDLSAELVNLIIAQRNYQANAKTIETSNAVTQTIINLR
ncbi:MAG: flagellar hook protein FlgE [Marinobacter sp.]|jgi:flagellar hook protein FlgE|uniref:flagellar hook protein FlgE n=1 Tax=unclassified Marinobacter TaxID=83889 RepID=UPI00069D9AD3|nr:MULTISPECIES: flagellar hook protein FlgE [unclassified Marinobacter]AKV97956.1 flagellar hook protein FlgE [Marinobacter sp. CP1]MAZ06507.1 flagellar hook protein FlgE [Halomonas sp.]MBI46870.1 flagellar hook protein FlgE [Marinobacter sp.]MCP4062320.1 flagellar hook protein FlgE [Gammaproteobacteria bacterium]|tara:strand:+ start:18572 stop:20461 length:1890 start_codon:yes stop_codon:yes gene_type:complete